jgi:hypothetical protein
MAQLQASEAELAKAVAEMQHVKCQSTRDSERAKEQFELQCEELERQLKESQEKLQNVESERNILVVRLFRTSVLCGRCFLWMMFCSR